MAYKSLIDGQLRKAFVLAKDLAEQAIFSRVAQADFNFASGKSEIAPEALKIAKVIVFDGEKQAKGSKRIVNNVMVKAKDVGSLSEYDKVEFGGFQWTIVRAVKGTGYILVFEAVREG